MAKKYLEIIQEGATIYGDKKFHLLPARRSYLQLELSLNGFNNNLFSYSLDGLVTHQI